MLPHSTIIISKCYPVCIILSAVAEFRFTELSYTVTEGLGAQAAVVIELISGRLTFDILVTVATAGGGSAQGIQMLNCIFQPQLIS